MGMLHEVLAARTKREEQAANAIKQAKSVFGAPHLFEAFREDYRHLEEDPMGRFRKSPKESNMMATVPEILDQLRDEVSPIIDLMATVDQANMVATAKVEAVGLDLPELPTTQLLSLEKRVKELRKTFELIPVHDPKIQWKPDPNRANVSISEPQQTFVTMKRTSWDVVVPPTPEHRAEVRERTEDPIVGERTKILWSGKISQKEQDRLLAACDELAVQIHTALARANQIEAKPVNIGEAIFDWILGEM